MMPESFYTSLMSTNKHREDEVRATINAFPAALSHLDDEGTRLPIQVAK